MHWNLSFLPKATCNMKRTQILLTTKRNGPFLRKFAQMVRRLRDSVVISLGGCDSLRSVSKNDDRRLRFVGCPHTMHGSGGRNRANPGAGHANAISKTGYQDSLGHRAARRSRKFRAMRSAPTHFADKLSDRALILLLRFAKPKCSIKAIDEKLLHSWFTWRGSLCDGL